MVDAVNGLVARLLTGAGEVFLPDVGSLVTERRAAQRISRRQIMPPYRAVVFTSQQRGESLVDAIAVAAGVDAAKAGEIYTTWLGRVRDAGGTIAVEGVGVLKMKHFTVEEAFDRQLNPAGRQAVALRRPRRFDWTLWIGGAAMLFAVAFGVWQYLIYDGKPAPEEVRNVAPAAAPELSDGSETGNETLGAAALAADPTIGSDAAAEPAAATSEADRTDRTEPQQASSASRSEKSESGVLPLASGRRYVVLGVFSTPENALRAAAAVEAENPVLRCGVYRFGAKYMVSPFESEEQEACTQFIRAHAEAHPGMWTYTAR